MIVMIPEIMTMKVGFVTTKAGIIVMMPDLHGHDPRSSSHRGRRSVNPKARFVTTILDCVASISTFMTMKIAFHDDRGRPSS